MGRMVFAIGHVAVQKNAAAQTQIISMPSKIRQFRGQIGQTIDQGLMIIVIPQDEVKMARRAGMNQVGEPGGGPVHGLPVILGARPTEIENVAAKHEIFGRPRGKNHLVQILPGLGAARKQVQVGDKKTFIHAFLCMYPAHSVAPSLDRVSNFQSGTKGTVPIFVSTKMGLSPLGWILTILIVLTQKLLQAPQMPACNMKRYLFSPCAGLSSLMGGDGP